MPSIKISELERFLSISPEDFIPLVDSGSLTTYRVPISAWNALWDTYGSASHADSSSLSDVSISSSYALSSSYAISSSWASTASYVDGSNVSGTVTSASYAFTSSYSISSSFTTTAISASRALSSSYAFSSSNAFSSSYAYSSSYAVTSSHALVADALSSPTAVTVPPLVKSLYVYPNSTPYEASNNTITLRADEIILYNDAGNAVRLSSVSQTPNKTVSGAGGLHGAWANNEWYDLYIIYNSGTTTTSAMITGSGANPRETVVDFNTGIPTGYDYCIRVGSVKDEGGTLWREWYEYGMNTLWVYRKTLPSGIGLSNGFTVPHHLGTSPRKVSIRLKINSIDTALGTWGYAVGDELREDDFISDYGGGDVDYNPFGIITTNSVLKFWRSRYDNGLETSIPANGNGSDWRNYSSRLDVIIYSER